MTKKLLNVVMVGGAAGAALLFGGCVGGGGYVEEPQPVYHEAGYVHPVYADRGPYYRDERPVDRETVVINTDSSRRDSEYRRSGHVIHDDGRRADNHYVDHARGTQFSRNRQAVPSDRAGQAHAQKEHPGKPGTRAVAPEKHAPE